MNQKNNPNPKICPECGENVVNLKRHKWLFHKLKFAVLRCKICTHVEMKDDTSFFRRHLAEHGLYSDNLLHDYGFQVPNGFYQLWRCPQCTYKSLEYFGLEAHINKAHVPQYFTAEFNAQRRQGADNQPSSMSHQPYNWQQDAAYNSTTPMSPHVGLCLQSALIHVTTASH